MPKGIVRVLLALFGTNAAMGNHNEALAYKEKASGLLINFNRAPIPQKMLNQRQKRKRARWANRI
jgi:hypothetical protein